MESERLASTRIDISNILSADFLVDKNNTLLKVNKTKLVGRYPTLASAREVLNGLLLKNGCRDPYSIQSKLNESVTYLNTFSTQNQQVGNNVGTMFSQVATGGIIDTTNANYIEIKTDNVGTFNSRARVINENEVFGVLSADVWRSYLFQTSRYTAKASVSNFNNSLWNLNTCMLGFHGNHSGNLNLDRYNCEKGCIFTPNSNGNWRCRWFQTVDENSPFYEAAYKDTEYSILVPQTLEIVIENFGRTATWLINGKTQFTVVLPSQGLTVNLGTSTQKIDQVIYSKLSDDVSLGIPPSLGFSAYVGAEVRRRSTGSSQYSIQLYNQKLETL